jgi:uncharacterized protein YqgQ
MPHLWSGALGTEVELFVSFQRDVWCRADLIWQRDEREERQNEELPSMTRVILALSVTRETTLDVSFQRDVWCRADLVWRRDEGEEIQNKLPSMTRVILALSVTRETTLAVGGALSLIN